MKLFEITNGKTGKAYVRCYCWAKSEEHAMEMVRRFGRTAGDADRVYIKLVFSDDFPPFITDWSDTGFPSEFFGAAKYLQPAGDSASGEV